MALLLEATNLSHTFTDQELFSCKQLQIFSGDKIGLIGANGSGKSTLLHILFGTFPPDRGTVRRLCDINYFTQFDPLPTPPDDEQLRRYHVINKIDQPSVSGGEATKIKIAQTIQAHTPLIFADEITTHLDTPSKNLLLTDLQRCETLLIVSHDRHLLDQICNKIIAIEDGIIRSYQGNYSDYLAIKEQENGEAEFAYQQYTKEKKRLQASVTRAKQRANAIKSAPSRMGNSEARLHKGEVKSRQKVAHRHATVLEHRLKSLEVKHSVPQKRLSFDFTLTHPLANKWLMQAENLTFAYPDQAPLYQDAHFIIPNGSKTALYGENGCGKSTLINQIIHQASGIHLVPQVKLGIFKQDLSNIIPDKTLFDNAMLHSVRPPAIVRAMLAGMGFSSVDYHKRASQLSGGERVKLSLCSIFASQANLLLLDEPTNFLDILAVETLQQMLSHYPGTVILVSHDQALVQRIATRLIIFDEGNLRTHEGDLASYLITKT
ncbi:ribosomal protection-like ABC-F family protein [Entomospira culicis]|uniref:ABC-F family ATP-binding cassette domain-containing protein n=1 Tax=Entomospira culicis TaxID=2719989 RepID=A0A968GER5_9SPIO|nr:ABC-F family ATP-binding cassette domain-containing protein [Entomospira culicis]NIZ18482.1 ABC-F family ATP-binding cassette domain-containing protein [Entomospira culicis]NIZ68698.1 ABC-F family ATP-binding cassette domain-containing protein [Entomospira culicis]WDI37297.1 ABC-F family ATP-binding cassette domain-containing protein [Entomospira culicis]WDI38926.1 ABC-F family ATP-binding cassette domain-containing protein [Entomospira culicis]